MRKIWEMYPRLCKAVHDDHIKFGMKGTGHDFDHPLQAGQIALLIAEDEYVGEMAGVAGICHNADRLLQRKLGLGKKGDVPTELVVEMVTRWLSAESFSEAWKVIVISAVLGHSEINKPDDSSVLKVLKDADRITCSMAENVMTAAQFHIDLPALDPKWLTGDPTAHPYKDPKSVLKGLECRHDWIDPGSPVCVRTPKAVELMRRRADFMRRYIDEVVDQRREIGLVPYPEL